MKMRHFLAEMRLGKALRELGFVGKPMFHSERSEESRWNYGDSSLRSAVTEAMFCGFR
jgi:hypothetical protein